MSPNTAKSAETQGLSDLRDALDLSPYEVRCIATLLRHDQLNASALAADAKVPRSRVYDVLHRLSVRGLVVETPGRPARFALVDPLFGFVKGLEERQRAVLGKLEHDRALVLGLADSLSALRGAVMRARSSREIGWTIGPAAAAMAYHVQLKRSCRESYTGISKQSAVPSEVLFDEERLMLRRRVKARLIRPFPHNLSLRNRALYRDLVSRGFQIRQSDNAEISFDVFDHREVLLWLEEDNHSGSSGVTWIRHSALAHLLESYFDAIWGIATPLQL